jgi:hypothetical protein
MLKGCWMGILWAARDIDSFRQSDAIHLCGMVCEMAWASNKNLLGWQHAQREKLIKGRKKVQG